MSKKRLEESQKRTQAYLQGNEIKKERRKWTMKQNDDTCKVGGVKVS